MPRQNIGRHSRLGCVWNEVAWRWHEMCGTEDGPFTWDNETCRHECLEKNTAGSNVGCSLTRRRRAG
jgi:hypothetical protein